MKSALPKCPLRLGQHVGKYEQIGDGAFLLGQRTKRPVAVQTVLHHHCDRAADEATRFPGDDQIAHLRRIATRDRLSVFQRKAGERSF